MSYNYTASLYGTEHEIFRESFRRFIEDEIEPVTLAYLPGLEGVDLRLSVWNVPVDEADLRLQRAAKLLRSRAGEHVYAAGDTDLAAVLLERARALGLRLAVAESCTGGLIGARLTEIPGSSDVFVGGVIAYDNRIKVEQLEVPPSLLAEHGAKLDVKDIADRTPMTFAEGTFLAIRPPVAKPEAAALLKRLMTDNRPAATNAAVAK